LIPKYYIKYALLVFLNLILSVLSYTFPKTKNQILLGSKDCVHFLGNPKYFFLYLCSNNTGFTCFWITKNKKLYAKLLQKKLPVLYLYSFKGFFSILRSNFLVFDHRVSNISYSIVLPGKFNKIKTYHGTPLKRIEKGSRKSLNSVQKILESFNYNSNENSSYKIILATCEESKKIFINAFNNKRVEILGYPRNDVFFNERLIFEDYKKSLDLEKYQKIILYCPTFRDHPTTKTVFSLEFLENLNKYLRDMNYVFLIKRHIHYTDIIPTHDFSNILDVSDKIDDVQDLLVSTDILITDYSSVFFDFILLNKPIIFYCYDFDEYLKNSRDLYYDYFNELPGPFAKNENELLPILKSIDHLFNAKEYLEKYNKFVKRFNYFQDGNSSQRLCDYFTNNM